MGGGGPLKNRKRFFGETKMIGTFVRGFRTRIRFLANPGIIFLLFSDPTCGPGVPRGSFWARGGIQSNDLIG